MLFDLQVPNSDSEILNGSKYARSYSAYLSSSPSDTCDSTCRTEMGSMSYEDLLSDSESDHHGGTYNSDLPKGVKGN